MDGRQVVTPTGTVLIQTVMVPVLWDPFTAGIIEKAFRPRMQAGANQVRAAITVSRGSYSRFDLEQYNSWSRGTTADNDRLKRAGTIRIPADVPRAPSQPSRTYSTLPMSAMQSAGTGTYAVVTNPTGGTYLSNESAYRVTALRDALGVNRAAGHIHIPPQNYALGGTPDSVQRARIVAQTQNLVVAAALDAP